MVQISIKSHFRFVSIVSLITVCMFILSWTFGPGPTMNENSFQIDGDGFNNQLVKLGIKAHEFENNFYAKASYNYHQDYQNMTFRISGANNSSAEAPITGIHMDFNNFTKPGIYTSDSSISISVFYKKDIPSNEYEIHYMLESDGVVNIKTFESIGGLIEGTFSGTFVKVQYNKESNSLEETDITVKISNGKFSLIHNPDFHWDAPQSIGSEPEDFKEKKKKGKKI